MANAKAIACCKNSGIYEDKSGALMSKFIVALSPSTLVLLIVYDIFLYAFKKISVPLSPFVMFELGFNFLIFSESPLFSAFITVSKSFCGFGTPQLINKTDNIKINNTFFKSNQLLLKFYNLIIPHKKRKIKEKV